VTFSVFLGVYVSGSEHTSA